ncbi:hypothetical protein AJY72_07595, partial [Campylobacter jejuni]
GGYITLFKKLYKIKKQHKKEQKIYQQSIQVFPQLKYPSLETCSDYEQALRYKFHLSYMLGEVLIKADKTWYKGSGFKLKNDIEKAKKEFQIFREIFKEFDQISSSILQGLIDNKQLFLKKFLRIKNILKIHQDYKTILDNIFHNFNYFIQNFDLIEEWLLSDDFNERYKKGNHPYPSLLDPKKLNDENEKINYHNIPAELAWDMNLPLPDGYKFVFIRFSLSGGAAMFSFFDKCKVDTCVSSVKLNFIKNLTYKDIYNKFKCIKDDYCISIFDDIACKTIERSKLLYFIKNDKKILILVRDPIERLKHAINHGDYKYDHQRFNENIDTRKSIEDEINRSFYFFDDKNCNFYDFVKGCITWPTYNYKKIINPILNTNEILYLDMKDIMPDKAFDTMLELSKILNFNPPKLKDKDFFQGIKNSDYRFHIPVSLCFYKNNHIFFKIYVCLKSNDSKSLININKELIKVNHILLRDLSFLINQEDIHKIDKYYKHIITQYQINFLNILEKRIKYIQKNKITAEQVLVYLHKNSELKKILKQILDEELIHIKQHCPDIIASWKYYQEFEKMCKELDGNI